MVFEMLTPTIVTLSLICGLVVLFICGLVACIVVVNRLKRIQSSTLLWGNQTQDKILQLETSTLQSLQQSQKVMEERVRQFEISTQESLKQLEISQSSTQTTVSITQQETQRFVNDFTALQHTSQALMSDVKMLHSNSHSMITDWKKETTLLSQALRTNYQQGVWGERELRQIVQLAGMIQHCDFDIKPKFSNGQVPDLVIHMPDQRSIAVDSKAPSQAYLDAMHCEDEKTRTAKLEGYARRVRETMYELAKKEYWKELQPSPDLVILFLPNEAMFRAALEYDLTLLDIATTKNVMLASPVTLITLLKAIEYGWNQEHRAQNVQHIVDQSKELQVELEQWFRQWQPLKKAIQTTSNEFDRVVKQYENTVFPRIKELVSLDGKLLMKEKSFEIKPLQQYIRKQEKETRLNEQETFPFQKKIISQFEKLGDVIPLTFFSRKEEQERHHPKDNE